MKLRVIVYLLLAAVAVGMMAQCSLRDDRLETNLPKIKSGMSSADVIKLMGEPSWDSPCESRFPYGADKGCMREFGYSYGLAPLNPLYYMVQFGKDGRVLRADEISSP